MDKRQITHLADALVAASAVAHSSSDGRAMIYYTTNLSVTAGITSGELYLVFRGDDPTQYHLRDDQGWRQAYAVETINVR